MRLSSGLGSDCCGLSSDFLALKLCGIQVETKFMSEVDDSKISMGKAMHARYGCSPQVHGDITLRNPKDMDQVDLFVSGAPCPAYSTAGLKKGIKDLRGCVILHSLKYIVLRRPAVACLENVKGMTHKSHKQVLDKIIEVLKSCNYKVTAAILNTADHGIPQNRERLYLVAVHRSKLDKTRGHFKFPSPVTMPKLKRFLVHKCQQASELSERERGMVKALRQKIGIARPEKLEDEVVMDIGATMQFANVMNGVSPCLTKTKLNCQR